MRSTQAEVAAIIDREGLIGLREHPELARSLAWLRERGRLVSVLPGWYVRPIDQANATVKIAAVTRADPDCVITGRAAARLSFWPELRADTVEVATRMRMRPQPGYRFTRRIIPPVMISEHGPVRLTAPALTALDLVPELGGEAIDEVLRSRTTTLTMLHDAFSLTSHRRGNRARAQALLESRDNAWSCGERRLHMILHAAGIEGWVTNLRVRVAEGVFYLDVAFDAERLALEVDGWTWHARLPGDFTSFLRRHTALEAGGWTVLHFGWDDLENRADWVVEKIRQALNGKTCHSYSPTPRHRA